MFENKLFLNFKDVSAILINLKLRVLLLTVC